MFAILGVLGALKTVTQKIWTAVSKVFPWLAPATGLFALYAVFQANYDALVIYLNQMSAYLSTQPATGYLAMANRIFPISEALSMVLALFTLRKAALVARFVRAMMPF